MTKHKIDDLFNQKLAGSESTPSPAAWTKLEGQLAQKKKKGIMYWLSVAASIALLLTFGWPMLKSDNSISAIEQIAQDNDINAINSLPIDSAKSQVKTDVAQSEDTESVQIGESEPKEEVKEDRSKSNKKQKVIKSSTPLIPIQQERNLATSNKPESTSIATPENRTEEFTDISQELVIDTNETLASNNSPGPVITAPSKESGSIKIVYTLKPVIASTNVVQEVENKTKVSPFKKAVAFAKNVKQNPKGIGSLREAKNNFLSLNKKKNGSK